MKKLIPMFIFLIHSISASAAMECNYFLGGNYKTSVNIYGDFDPKEAFRQAGYRPGQINLKIDNKPAGFKDFDETTLDFNLMADKISLGELGMYEHGDEEWATYSGLNGVGLAKGIGALMYMIGAEIIFRLYPEAQKLISFDGSQDANFMWEKLVRTGHAIKWTEDPPTEPNPRWVYELHRKHITPKLSKFISQRRVYGSELTKQLVKQKQSILKL